MFKDKFDGYVFVDDKGELFINKIMIVKHYHYYDFFK